MMINLSDTINYYVASCGIFGASNTNLFTARK